MAEKDDFRIIERMKFIDAENPGDLVMLVLPGGGYENLADHEGEPVARWLAGLGYSSAVLSYSLRQQAVMPRPLEEAVAAIRALCQRNPGKLVGVIGFSAGAHLAALTAHADAYLEAADAVPDLIMLGYPLISLVAKEFEPVIEATLGAIPSLEDLAHWSPISKVDEATPPTFTWANCDDDVTRVADHALPYAQALSLAGVAHELHLFDQGGHGVGLAEGAPCAEWVPLAEAWLDRTVRGLLATRQAESVG